MSKPETTKRERWEAAYRTAFRAEAKARGWSAEHIESGWLDEWPREAWLSVGWRGQSAVEAATQDVQIAEMEAANA